MPCTKQTSESLVSSKEMNREIGTMAVPNSFNNYKHTATSQSQFQGTLLLVTNSAIQPDENTNNAPTPTFESLPQEQEEGGMVLIAIIVILVVIVIIVLLIAFVVIGIVTLKANTTKTYEFKPSSEKGTHACKYTYIHKQIHIHKHTVPVYASHKC